MSQPRRRLIVQPDLLLIFDCFIRNTTLGYIFILTSISPSPWLMTKFQEMVHVMTTLGCMNLEYVLRFDCIADLTEANIVDQKITYEKSCQIVLMIQPKV